MEPKNLPARPPERRIVSSGVAYLSADKEIGPFLFYLLGDDIDMISFKTSLPKDTLQVTCLHYGWEARREALVKDAQAGSLIKEVEKSLLNNILMATYATVMRQAGDVIAGNATVGRHSLIPDSMQGLQRLLEMIEKANGLVATNQNPPAPTTVVHAENVQINQGAPAPGTQPYQAKRVSLLDKLYDKSKKEKP